MEEAGTFSLWTIGGMAAGGIALVLLVFGSGRWVGGVNADRTAFKQFMEEIRSDIEEVLSRLAPVTVARGSPVRLTDLGREISSALDVKAWASGQADTLLERAWEMKEHEVYDLCTRHGIEVEKVQDVYTIELRDEPIERLKAHE